MEWSVYSVQRKESGKPIWAIFRLQSVHIHASSQIHCDVVRKELDHQLSLQDGGISQAVEHSWEVEKKQYVQQCPVYIGSPKRKYHT